MRLSGKSVLLLAGLVAGMVAFSGTPAEAYTGWYWCGGGDRVLQVQGTKVRCWIAAKTDYKPINNCLPGQVYRKNYNGNRDKCVIGICTAEIVNDPGCPGGFSLNRRSGKDNCKKYMPARSYQPQKK